MNSQLEKALLDMYKDEIDINSLSTYTTLLKMLILYKNLANIESYFYENKLNIIVAEDGKSLRKDAKNSIIIGGKSYMSDEYIDQLISAFINRNIENDSDKYAIYLDHDNRVVHITKADHSFGYSVFNSTIEKVFCALLTRIMPWYFGDLPGEITQEFAPLFVDNNEFHLFDFDEKFEKHIEEAGLKDKIFMQQMANLAVKITEKKKRAVEDKLKSDQNSMDSLFREIHQLNARIKEHRATLLAIELQGKDYESPVNELVEFISNTTEKITIEEVLDETIKFKFVTSLAYFDEYEGCIATNPGNSYLFGHVGMDGDNPFKQYSTEQVKEFYKMMIEDQVLKVYASGYIDMNIVNGECRARSCDVENAMPHHHLAIHNCFGTARDIIASYAIANRYAEALNQAVYAAKQSTLGDSAAGKYFVTGMVKNKCIECPDGQFRNFDETMKYLIAEGMIAKK